MAHGGRMSNQTLKRNFAFIDLFGLPPKLRHTGQIEIRGPYL